MNKRHMILIVVAVCTILLMGMLSVLNRFLDYEKTIVIDDRADTEVLVSSNSDMVQDVKLQELPDAASVFDTYQLQFWHNEELLLTHTNPLFKLDKSLKPVPDMSSAYSPYLNPQTDFSKNAIYTMKPDSGKLKQLIETNPYNVVRCYLSPDGAKMLLFEAYNIIGSGGADIAAAKIYNSEPFTVDGYGNIKNRIRIYDFHSKDFYVIDEWDSKYLTDKNDYGDTGIYNTFGDLGWSLDGRGIVYCEKAAEDKYLFKIFNLDTAAKIEYTMQESGKRFEKVYVHAISKDLKRVWFSGVNAFIEDSLGFDLDNAESSIYMLDMNKNREAQELVKDMGFTKVLSDENTIIYTSEFDASNSTFKLYQYNMSQKQSKLIDENVYAEFEVSMDEKKLAYASTEGSGFEIKMVGIDSDPKQGKTILYKSSPNSYRVNGLSWNYDSSKLSASYYIDNGMGKSSGQICVLALKLE